MCFFHSGKNQRVRKVIRHQMYRYPSKQRSLLLCDSASTDRCTFYLTLRACLHPMYAVPIRIIFSLVEILRLLIYSLQFGAWTSRDWILIRKPPQFASLASYPETTAICFGCFRTMVFHTRHRHVMSSWKTTGSLNRNLVSLHSRTSSTSGLVR